MESFLARVVKVYPTNEKPFDRVTGGIKVYNDNSTFTKEDSGRLYGAISYVYQNAIVEEDYAFPFDKNNFTFPIMGETVTIIKIENETFYLPYSNPPYPNYREKSSISTTSERTSNKVIGDNKTAADVRNTVETGGSSATNTNTKEKENRGGYIVNEKIKFLQPRNGDTIISGRAGNTIRFSEFFLTEDETIDSNGNPKGGTSSPSIFIRNKQNQTEDSEPIGTLIEESIDKDGTSVYITSGKVKIPFRETIKKQKVAFKGYPNSKDLKGNQFFVNSDRVVLSAKAYEFIIFGKGNTGVITDGRFTVDSIGDTHIHSNNNIVLQTNRNIVFGTEGTGNIWLGGVKPTKSQAGEDFQKMVMGGELVKILEDLIDEIIKQKYATSCGPTGPGPENIPAFKSIKGRLKTILSARNYLSK
jgi:hypothetical protein